MKNNRPTLNRPVEDILDDLIDIFFDRWLRERACYNSKNYHERDKH